ncbi:MAG: hypothetical protein D6732_10790 [Methanobacteriota archaeon]|nr:MAG: hypothetical protein D6732_10790 [Euryarchaeota archaeon]
MKKQRMKTHWSVLSVFLLVLAAAVNVPALTLVTGRTFLVYTGEGVFAPEINGFYANYTEAGNTVINGTDMTLEDLRGNLTADVDALFLPAIDLSDMDLSFIKEWFDLGGKMLWVGGDSDFGGFFIADNLNPALEEVGSVLRLDSGAVDDPVSNDGASYRVVANQLDDGPIASAIKEHVDGDFKMPFHGPTSVYYMKDGEPFDLRNADLDNVEVVVMSSPLARAIDQDLSQGVGDFYSNIDAIGNLPLLAVETIGSNMVVVSGEAVFKDYKNMYGNRLERSGEFHYGSIVVDTVISFMPSVNSSSETSSRETTTNSSTLTSDSSPILSAPISLVPFAIAVIVLVRKRIL